MKSDDMRTESAIKLQNIVNRNIRMRLAVGGIEQTQLGEAIGVTQGAISLKLRGVRAWSLDDLAAVADFFGIEVTDLVTDTVINAVVPQTRNAGVRFLIYPQNGIKKCPPWDSNPQPTT